MQNKAKGNRYLEIAIAVLIILLILTIWYPSNVWKNEDVMRDICHHRMEAIQAVELQYYTLNNYMGYTDSLSKAIEWVRNDPYALAALDSNVYWDGLVTGNDLKAMVKSKSFPADLRTLIQTTLDEGRPLAKLAKWDSLEYQLIREVRSVVTSQPDSGEKNLAGLDSAISWIPLLGEHVFRNLIAADTLPRRIKTRTSRQILEQGVPVYQSAGWSYIQPMFYDSLESLIQTALRSDVYTKAEEELWEEETKAIFMANLDTIATEDQDSLWIENQSVMWESQEDLLWKEDRDDLWDVEKSSWTDSNEATWKRVVKQDWTTARKKAWIKKESEARVNAALEQFEDKSDMIFKSRLDTSWSGTADSLQMIKAQWLLDEKAKIEANEKNLFKAERDSLWRNMVDSLWEQDREKHYSDQAKQIARVQKNLWEQERRLTWKDTRFAEWIEEKQEDREALWIEVKEQMWKSAKPDMWREEEKKLAKKMSTLHSLDENIVWNQAVDAQTLFSMVDGLDLPDTHDILSKMEKVETGSALYELGIVPLLRDQLFAYIGHCPVAQTPYLIELQDEGALKSIGIHCPIQEIDANTVAAGVIKAVQPVDTAQIAVEETAEQAVMADSTETALLDSTQATEAVAEAEETPKLFGRELVIVVVDPVTKDTSFQDISINPVDKVFGGAKVKSHGFIDTEGKKSWEKKGR